jgi:magnesium transporter
MPNKNPYINEISRAGFTWVNVRRPGKRELDEIGKRFGFLEIDTRDCLPPLQRPKLVERPNYLFMVLLFPIYNRETGKIESSEVDFFISGKCLVTVHHNNLSPLNDMYEECERQKAGQALLKNPAHLLVELLTRLLKYCYPMIIHIGQDVTAVGRRVLEVHDSKATFEILRIKMNIVEFRDATDLHESVIRKLIKKSTKFLDTKKLDEYLQMLIEHAVEIRETLANYTSTIGALDDTHQSLINLRANQIMKNLQIFAVIVFPLTLLAGIFSMNISGAMPFAEHEFGFWIVLGVMVAGTLAMLGFFKWRKWY